MSVLYRVGVVAHNDRADAAHTLQESVGAQFLSMDNGTRGCGGNHRRVWEYLATQDSDFAVVIEDDALPVDGFREELTKVLDAAPEPIVSLYLGQKRPPQHQHQIGATVQRATQCDAHWITSTLLLHAVGTAIRTELVKPMLDGLIPDLPIDEGIGHWAALNHHRIAYTWPSIVDHDDGPSLVSHRDFQERTAGRVAWRIGRRDSWDQLNKVRMN